MKAPDPARLPQPLQRSDFLRELLAEREEILRHKWLRSEAKGGDIGMDAAVLEWTWEHRAGWRAHRQRRLQRVGKP